MAKLTYHGDSGAVYTAQQAWPVKKVTVTLPQTVKSLNHPHLLTAYGQELLRAVGSFLPERQINVGVHDIAGIDIEIVFTG